MFLFFGVEFAREREFVLMTSAALLFVRVGSGVFCLDYFRTGHKVGVGNGLAAMDFA